jgi:hypothetical protein
MCRFDRTLGLTRFTIFNYRWLVSPTILCCPRACARGAGRWSVVGGTMPVTSDFGRGWRERVIVQLLICWETLSANQCDIFVEYHAGHCINRLTAILLICVRTILLVFYWSYYVATLLNVAFSTQISRKLAHTRRQANFQCKFQSTIQLR